MCEQKTDLICSYVTNNCDDSIWLVVLYHHCPAAPGYQKGWHECGIKARYIRRFHRGHPSGNQQLCDVPRKLENSPTYTGILLCKFLLLIPTE